MRRFDSGEAPDLCGFCGLKQSEVQLSLDREAEISRLQRVIMDAADELDNESPAVYAVATKMLAEMGMDLPKPAAQSSPSSSAKPEPDAFKGTFAKYRRELP